MREVSGAVFDPLRDVDCKIVTNDNDVTYTSADIIEFDIQRKLTEKGVSVGNAISDRFSVVLRKSENDIPKKTRFNVFVKFGSGAWNMIGRFYVYSCTKNKHGYLNVTCMDFLSLLDKECKWKGNSNTGALAFPATFQQMLDYIMARYRLTCDFECMDWTQATKPEGYTYRQILSFIAASHCANVQIDEDGKVTFVQFTSADYSLSASNVISQTIDETAGYTVNGIYMTIDDETAIYIDDTEGSEYDEDATGIVKVNNPLGTVAIAEYCWNLLGGLSYISTTITKRGSASLQCGDVIPVYDYAGDPSADPKNAAITAIRYTLSASGGFTEQITSYADSEENRKTTPKKASSSGGSGSSGVGEWLDSDHTIERFNDYTNNSANGRYDHVEGSRNTATTTSPNHPYFPLCNHLEGYNNTLTQCQNTHIGGASNSVQNDTASAVHGTGNQLTGSYSSANNVVGIGNTASGNSHNVCGQRNTVTESCNIVGGQDNRAASDNGLTVGTGNENVSIDAVVCGSYGTSLDSKRLVVGGGDSSSRRNVFDVNRTGGVRAAGSYGTMGADYAEYFEWQDGNPDDEDRCGMLVMLDGDKIVPAHGDDILGAISAAPSVIGNGADLYWQGTYATDVYGRPVTNGKGERLYSSTYDPEKQYIPRSKRREWDAVGLVGRLIVRDNGGCAPGGFASASNGIAAPSLHETRVRVLKRIDSTHIEVLIR